MNPVQVIRGLERSGDALYADMFRLKCLYSDAARCARVYRQRVRHGLWRLTPGRRCLAALQRGSSRFRKLTALVLDACLGLCSSSSGPQTRCVAADYAETGAPLGVPSVLAQLFQRPLCACALECPAFCAKVSVV